MTGLPEKKVRYKSGPMKKPSRLAPKFIMRMSIKDVNAVMASHEPTVAARIAVSKRLRNAKDVVRGMFTADDADSASAIHDALDQLRQLEKAMMASTPSCCFGV